MWPSRDTSCDGHGIDINWKHCCQLWRVDGYAYVYSIAAGRYLAYRVDKDWLMECVDAFMKESN